MKKEQKQETIVVNQSQENYVGSKINTILEEESSKEKIEEKGIKTIKSPMVGTFYIKPSPTSDPYVETGKDIKKGDTLCIIEAMKLMNEIESEYTGKITEILVKDGDIVEYGTELFKIAVNEE